MNIEIWGTETNRRHFFIGTIIFDGKVFRFRVIFGPGLLEQTKSRPDIRNVEIQKRICVDIYDPKTFDPKEEFNSEIEIDQREEAFLIELIAGFLLNSYYDKVEQGSQGVSPIGNIELRDKFRRDDDTVPQLIKKYQAA